MNDATRDGGFVMSLSFECYDDFCRFAVHVIKAVFRNNLERRSQARHEKRHKIYFGGIKQPISNFIYLFFILKNLQTH